MKILKGIFYAILVIIVLFLVVAIFLPSEYKVVRSTNIDAPIENVYGYVADFNNFHGWNPWTPLELNHKYEVMGDSASVGQKYYWEGEVIGSGQMIFTEFKPYDLIVSNIEFLAPEQGSGIVEWTFEGDSTSTKVNWSLKGDADYPIGRYMGLVMDTFLGKSFEDGLSNLKEKFNKM